MFSAEFKTKAFQVCFPAGAARAIISALEANNPVRVRNILEDLLDDEWLYVNNNLGSNRKVKEGKELTFESRQELYTEFMDNYIKDLDAGRIPREYRVHI